MTVDEQRVRDHLAHIAGSLTGLRSLAKISQEGERMMRALPMAALVAIALSPSLARGADFYVCDCLDGSDADCTPGDDAADGDSPAGAWRTYDMAQDQFGSLAPGDAILFCRGGAFEVENGSRWVNTSCEAGDPCTVSAYEPTWGSGDEGLPILWVRTDGHAFALEDGGDAEHEEGYVISDLDLRCTVCESTGGQGFFLYNDIDDVVIENVLMDGFGIGVHLAGSNPCSDDPECDGLNSRLTLRGCIITNSVSQGFLGSGDGTVIEGNAFENNGSRATFDHNIYYSGGSHVSTGSRIVGNDLYRSDLDGDGSCAGVSLVVHGNHEDLLIEGNVVREDPGYANPGCWGIAVDAGYDEDESFTNVTIRGNRVWNVGNVSIGVSSCVGCVIENNVIVNEQDFGARAIAVPDRGPGAGDAETTGVVVRNNSIYMAGTGGTGILVGDEGSGHAIVSNAIVYAGSGSWSCIDANLDPGDYDEIDMNACHFPGASGEWNSGSGTSPDPLSAWQAASGFGSGSILADPAFSAPAGPDFDLSAADASSPMVDAGHPTMSSTVDIAGMARDAAPDIGAHEYGASAPPDATEPPPDATEPPPDATTDPDDDPSTDGHGSGGCGCAIIG